MPDRTFADVYLVYTLWAASNGVTPPRKADDGPELPAYLLGAMAGAMLRAEKLTGQSLNPGAPLFGLLVALARVAYAEGLRQGTGRPSPD